MFAATGSTTIAASPSPWRMTASAAASTSLYGTTIVSAAAPVGTPGEEGIPSVARPGAGAREQRVGVAVVAAGELEDPVALRERARQPQRAHRGLGPGGDEPHLLDRGHGVDDLRGELDLRLGRRAERSCRAAPPPRTASTVSGVGVAEEERPPRHDPVE